VNRSTQRILTTHVGSLPRSSWEVPLNEAVTEVVERQRMTGIDVINEGEYTKGGDWLSFADNRLSGFRDAEQPPGPPIILQGKDREEFADFYRFAATRGTLFFEHGEQIKKVRRYLICDGPVTYCGGDVLAREIELLLKAGKTAGSSDLFLTSTAPASLEVYRGNEFYKTEEEFLYAIANALAVEYRAIAQAGLILQVDDAWLPALWDRIGIQMGLDRFLRRCRIRVDALNHALKGIAPEQIRYHMCWGSWHGPHAFDLELKYLADILLSVNAGAYLIEGANVRHEHEWAVWQDVKLPDGKILIPGVVTHSTDLIEHPELVSQRIQRYAKLVGRENLIAGCDCGFGGRCHPDIAWAKLKSLVEGASLASQALWRN
jgi:5-methyltetrahydropteroyltriglutamate--homocysteine methyltransferase